MLTYVVLMNFTHQGITTVKDSPKRAQAAKAKMEKLGVTIKMLWTQGQYDLVSILEAPDEATARAVTLAIASQGNVRTQTLRAFTLDEMTATVDKLE